MYIDLLFEKEKTMNATWSFQKENIFAHAPDICIILKITGVAV